MIEINYVIIIPKITFDSLSANQDSLYPLSASPDGETKKSHIPSSDLTFQKNGQLVSFFL